MSGIMRNGIGIDTMSIWGGNGIPTQTTVEALRVDRVCSGLLETLLAADIGDSTGQESQATVGCRFERVSQVSQVVFRKFGSVRIVWCIRARRYGRRWRSSRRVASRVVTRKRRQKNMLVVFRRRTNRRMSRSQLLDYGIEWR